MTLSALWLAIAVSALIAWLWLLFGNAGFWRIERPAPAAKPQEWPEVVVVIPARDEGQGIAETLRSLWGQDYAREVRIVLVDDHSEDATVERAVALAESLGRRGALTVLAARSLPPGWTGKVWAMSEGISHGVPAGDPARYVLFSDADVRHGSSAVRDLVARAESGGLDLASLMVTLQCRTVAERLTIPAFVFFFRMLYPFRRANDRSDSLAAAAGGTMLLRRSALDRIGGLAAIRGELIDDCALARAVKRGGHRIWLGLGAASVSTRGYGRLRDIVHMVARTAYTQLGYSPARLAGCVAGLCLVYLAPPLLLFARGPSAAVGAVAWLLMAIAYAPMVRFYRQPLFFAPLLPLTATMYLYATCLSAWRHHCGRGGQWKGRSQDSTARSGGRG
ncbi:MAG TPA: glycosyltransferase [Chthonomonadaceae bacterium]|nr:glycosyltransferase [Chthonomonadaceae bacterium]